jgi:predicted transcriptional regulator
VWLKRKGRREFSRLIRGSHRSPGVELCVACGYTQGMKTAISLPDAIFVKAEKLAKRLKKSRSELYRQALSEFLARHDPDAVTEAMDRVADSIDTKPDDFSSAAARRVIKRTEW